MDGDRGRELGLSSRVWSLGTVPQQPGPPAGVWPSSQSLGPSALPSALSAAGGCAIPLLFATPQGGVLIYWLYMGTWPAGGAGQWGEGALPAGVSSPRLPTPPPPPRPGPTGGRALERWAWGVLQLSGVWSIGSPILPPTRLRLCPSLHPEGGEGEGRALCRVSVFVRGDLPSGLPPAHLRHASLANTHRVATPAMGARDSEGPALSASAVGVDSAILEKKEGPPEGAPRGQEIRVRCSAWGPPRRHAPGPPAHRASSQCPAGAGGQGARHRAPHPVCWRPPRALCHQAPPSGKLDVGGADRAVTLWGRPHCLH